MELISITVEELAHEFASNTVSKVFKPNSLNDAYYDVSYNARKLGFIAGYNTAQHLNRWIPVSEQEPPSGVEVLAKSPEGLIHLINWRPAYKIFTCQNKEESTYGWSWKTVE